MPIIVHGFRGSPTCRVVYMTLATLELDYEVKTTIPYEGHVRTQEYKKMNPQETVPVLVDDGFTIVDSRAIMLYLVRKYGKSDCTLLPKDPKLVSLVEQRLFMDLGFLWPKFFQMNTSIMMYKKMYDPEVINSLKKVLGWCEGYIRPTGFVASTQDMSIADISLLGYYTSLRACEQIGGEEFPILEDWAERCKKLVKDYEKCNGEGIEMLGKFYKRLLEEVKSKAAS